MQVLFWIGCSHRPKMCCLVEKTTRGRGQKIRRRLPGCRGGQNGNSLNEMYCLTIIGFQTVKSINTFIIISYCTYYIIDYFSCR